MAKTTKKTSAKSGTSTAPAKKKTAPAKATVKKATAKKAVTKKAAVKKTTAATKKTAAKKAPARKAATKKAPTAKSPQRSISTQERHQMIAEAAYLRGESQGFFSDEKEDWLLAETEVDALLAKARVTVSD